MPYCVACGADNRLSARFCISCGAVIAPAGAEPGHEQRGKGSSAPAPIASRSVPGKTLAWIAGLGLLAVLAAAGYLIWAKVSPPPPDKGTPAVDARQRLAEDPLQPQPGARVVAEAPEKPPPELAVPSAVPAEAQPSKSKARETRATAPGPATLRPPETTTAPSAEQAPAPAPEREAPQAKRTIDQIYNERVATECDKGFTGVLCRERLRHRLCDGKWTDNEVPGMRICFASIRQ